MNSRGSAVRRKNSPLVVYEGEMNRSAPAATLEVTTSETMREVLEREVKEAVRLRMAAGATQTQIAVLSLGVDQSKLSSFMNGNGYTSMQKLVEFFVRLGGDAELRLKPPHPNRPASSGNCTVKLIP